MAKPVASDLLLGPRNPPVRLCAECATRHHDRAVSRAAQVPLCTLCEASYDIIIGQSPPPAAGETIPGGATGSSARRGQRRCPRCRGLVSSAGYSWVHHMRWAAPLDPTPAAASSSVFLCKWPNLRCGVSSCCWMQGLRPSLFSGRDRARRFRTG